MRTLLLCLAFTASALLNLPRLPDPVSAEADPGEFSAMRAMSLVSDWARRPRPSGSATHHQVLDDLEGHLVEVGFDIQRHEAFTPRPVINLVGRSPDDSPGVWVVAHSDSVRESPGAADDGLGLAVLVEVARVINVDGPAPGFNVLVTDAEELGLVGAKAFVADSPAPRLVINLEARGTEGPVYMFQTAGADAPILDAWRESGCHAQATSLARAVYTLLPNDTDFSVFRQAGWWGYDFALIHGASRYHTKEDRPENLDPRSVQQLGDCVVGLVRAWSGVPQSGEAGAAPAYAQVLGETIVAPGWLVRTFGLALLLAAPWRQPRRAAWGALTGVASVMGVGGIGVLTLLGLLRVPGFLDRPAEMVGAAPVYGAAFVLGVLGLAATRLLVARRGPAAASPVLAGQALAGVALMCGVAMVWPVVGYVLLPGATASVALLRGRFGLALVAAAVAGVLTGPVLYAVYPALTTRLFPALALVTLYLLGWSATPLIPRVAPSTLPKAG